MGQQNTPFWRELHFDGGDPARLVQLGLPLLYTPLDLAAALGLEEQRLANLANLDPGDLVDHYRRFRIPKRRGGFRDISTPIPALRDTQRWLLDAILSRPEPHPAAAAFRPGRSTVDNARKHVGRAIVARIDLHDFFPSIRLPRVEQLFARFGYNAGVSTILASLVTERIPNSAHADRLVGRPDLTERRLPQGACTSPAIANLVCSDFDQKLKELAHRCGFSDLPPENWSRDNESPRGA